MFNVSFVCCKAAIIPAALAFVPVYAFLLLLLFSPSSSSIVSRASIKLSNNSGGIFLSTSSLKKSRAYSAFISGVTSNSSKISGSLISASSFASSAPPPAAPPNPKSNSIPPPAPTALKAEPPLPPLSAIKATGPVEEKLPSRNLLSLSTIFPEVDSALCREGAASLKREGDAPASAGPTCGDTSPSSFSKLPFPFVLLLAEGPGGGN